MDAFNARRQEVYTPSGFLTVDELFSFWKGLDGTVQVGGLPHSTSIPSKPRGRGIGVMMKTCTDGVTNIMLKLELQEGKAPMSTKEFQHNDENKTESDVHPYHTAVTLRLVKEYFNSQRTVVADSAFSSMGTACALLEKGLHFSGIVKQADKGFPMKSFVTWYAKNPTKKRRKLKRKLPRGSTLAFKTKCEHGKDIVAVGWVDTSLTTVVSTTGSMADGTPALRKRRKILHEENGPRTASCFFAVPRPYDHREFA